MRASTALSYVERVNRAIDAVLADLPRGGVRLTAVSRAAGLSPFHFHRVFQAMMGETLADFVKRMRLERAVSMMCHGVGGGGAGRRVSLTRVAMACGFSSPSDFTRSFKQRFGAPPSSFDARAWRAANAAELEALVAAAGRTPRVAGVARDNPDGFRVRVRDLPARTVAYIRVRDPYRGGGVVGAVARLAAWAEARGLAGGQWLGFQWENPEITGLERCVYHTAVVAEKFVASGEVGRHRFPPMVVAEVEVRGGIDLELRALRWLYGSWLPRSGYVPDDQPCFEAFMGRPFAHGMEHFELWAHLPVRR